MRKMIIFLFVFVLLTVSYAFPTASGDETKNIPEITLEALADREQSIKNYIMQHSDACELLVEHLLQTYVDRHLIAKEG